MFQLYEKQCWGVATFPVYSNWGDLYREHLKRCEGNATPTLKN